MAGINKNVNEVIDDLITKNEAVLFSATYCKYCTEVKNLFSRLDVKYETFEIDQQEDAQLFKDELYKRTNQKTVPSVFINGLHMGGCDDTIKKYENGSLQQYLQGKFKTFDYDLIVVGGGPAGIASALEAAALNKKVALFDYVTPTTKGTKWGVGGVSLNVGSTPLRLMHHAAMIGDLINDSTAFGWEVNRNEKANHNWSTMVENVQNYIKKTNFTYVKYFKTNNIKYFNARVTFINIHTIEATDKKGNVNQYTAYRFILATGSRPHIPNFPGKYLAITTDDLFSLPTKPSKTLVIGGSYIALECAGFLQRLGVDCTVMYRSQLLRGYDQEITEMIGDHMQSLGITFMKGYVPLEITIGTNNADPNMKFKVKITKAPPEISEPKEDYYNMVLLATGRDATVEGLGLDTINVKVNSKSKRVIADKTDLTNCHTVYAVGDVQDGHIQMASVAKKAGKRVVQRLFAIGEGMDYSLIPIILFTPLEYGSCGYSEEEAKRVFGEDVECFNKHFQPLEWELTSRNIKRCYCKLVCAKSLNNKVIGLHVLGPNAGEIIQGFALALKMNVLKSDFDRLIGIHPTSAETFTTLETTKPDQSVATTSTC